MLCPKCKVEYREGFSQCSDCHIPLTDSSSLKKKQQNSSPKMHAREMAGSNYGGLSQRFLSMLIDGLIVSVPSLILLFLGLGGKVHFLFQILISLIYATFFVGERGNTPGQKMMGLKIVALDRAPLGYLKAFFRALVYLIYYVPLLGAMLGIVSWVMLSITAKKQTLHDKICKTIVLDISKPPRSMDFFEERKIASQG